MSQLSIKAPGNLGMISGDPVPARNLLYAAAIGAFAQLAQILLVRELLDSLRGGELLLGVIFAAHLLAGALGILLASAQPGRWLFARGDGTSATRLGAHSANSGTTPRAAAITLLPFLTASTLLGTLAFARIAGTTLATPLHLCLFTAAGYAVPVPLLCGLLFGRLLRTNATAGVALYQSDTWGAVAAGMVFSLALGTTAAFPSAAIAGIVLIAAAWLGSADSWTTRRSFIMAFTVLTLFVIALLPLDRILDRYAWHRRLPDHELREIRVTANGRLAVLARPGHAHASFFRGAALVGTIEDPPPPEERALADLLACLLPRIQEVVIVGGSASSLPRQFGRHNPRRLCLLDTDPTLLDLTRQYSCWPPVATAMQADPRRATLKLLDFQPDLILVFPGHLDSLLSNRLATLEFFHGLHSQMAPDGIMAISLPAFGAGSEYISPAVESRNRAVAAALQRVFHHVRAIPVNGCLLVASQQPIPLDPATLAQRLADRPNAAPAIVVAGEQIPVTPRNYFDSLFGGVLAAQKSLDGFDRQEAITRFESQFVDNCDPPNSDLRPRALLPSLAIGGELTGHNAFNYRGLDHPWTAVISLVILIAITALFRIGRGRSGVPMSAAFRAMATGFFAITFEVALLHLYQTRYGNLIHEIGWLLACFMAGLAIGARYGNQARTRPELRQCLPLLGMMLLCILVVVKPVKFSALMLSGGFCAGTLFAMLVRQHPRHASRLYAADLIGSAAGAILIGTFWLPSAGLTYCMFGIIVLLVIAMSFSASSASRTCPGLV